MPATCASASNFPQRCNAFAPSEGIRGARRSRVGRPVRRDRRPVARHDCRAADHVDGRGRGRPTSRPHPGRRTGRTCGNGRTAGRRTDVRHCVMRHRTDDDRLRCAQRARRHDVGVRSGRGDARQRTADCRTPGRRPGQPGRAVLVRRGGHGWWALRHPGPARRPGIRPSAGRPRSRGRHPDRNRQQERHPPPRPVGPLRDRPRSGRHFRAPPASTAVRRPGRLRRPAGVSVDGRRCGELPLLRLHRDGRAHAAARAPGAANSSARPGTAHVQRPGRSHQLRHAGTRPAHARVRRQPAACGTRGPVRHTRPFYDAGRAGPRNAARRPDDLERARAGRGGRYHGRPEQRGRPGDDPLAARKREFQGRPHPADRDPARGAHRRQSAIREAAAARQHENVDCAFSASPGRGGGGRPAPHPLYVSRRTAGPEAQAGRSGRVLRPAHREPDLRGADRLHPDRARLRRARRGRRRVGRYSAVPQCQGYFIAGRYSGRGHPHSRLRQSRTGHAERGRGHAGLQRPAACAA